MIIPAYLDKLKAEKAERSKVMDHLGLVMGMCKELNLIEIIDSAIPNDSPDKILSTGTGVVGMVLNGLGFVNKRLYMVDHFFESKPVSKLFEIPYLKSEHFNDDALGRILDSIYAYGVSELYHIISKKTVGYLKTKYGLECNIGQLDNSTLHLHGNSYEGVEDGEELVEIVPGYSKDNRPDLNQIGIQLIVENKSRIPLLFKALSGNAEEGKTYRQAIKRHINALQVDCGLKWIVADSKLYSQANIKELSLHEELDWLTRVPVTIGEVSHVQAQIDKSALQEIEGMSGYSYMELGSLYGGINHRWVLIHSEQKEEQDLKTLEKRIIRQSKKEEKALKSLGRQEFSSISTALAATKSFAKTLKYSKINDFELITKNKYAKAGKPAKGQVPLKIVYKIQASLCADEESLEQLRCVQGYYIMATSELDEKKLSVGLMIQTYKQQASVERGFRFLKDPMIMGSSLFLQKTQRIMALLMIMTLCLLVYSALEFKIRALLEEKELTIKGRLGKPTNRPSLRWIFECFEGIHYLEDNQSARILNRKPRHHIILDILGEKYWKYYV